MPRLTNLLTTGPDGGTDMNGRCTNHRPQTVLIDRGETLRPEARPLSRAARRNGRLSATARLILLVFLVAASLNHFAAPSYVEAAGNEARCNELGANCICSEPFNTTAFTGGPDFWNPSDTTTKECSVEAAVTGGAIVRTSNTIVGSNDATAMAALPPGHTNRFFVRADDNHEGTYFAGNGIAVSPSFVRLAARFYIYHSPTFDYEGEGSCRNSKQVELDGDSRIDYNTGAGFHTYNYLQFSPAIDCCVSGPAVNQPAVSGFKGKWVRHEIVLTNRSGSGYRLQSFMKNVSTNGPEVAVIDTSRDSRVSNVRPPMLMSRILSNNHRWSNGATCRGWIGLSHYMMAGWTTDSGQRIGAAPEIETGGGGATPDTVPPSPPSSPSLSLSSPKMLLSGFLSPAVLLGTVVGLAVLRGKRSL